MKRRLSALLGFTVIFCVAICVLPFIGCDGGGDGNGSSGGTIEVYVSTSGSDSNDGSKDSPLATIQAALQKKSDENAVSAEIYVAGGTYSILSDGFFFDRDEIQGGYSADFNDRDIALYKTTIKDTRLSGTWPTAVTLEDSTMEGFTIKGADGTETSRAVSILDSATFKYNTVQGGAATSGTDGIAINGVNNTIKYNTIIGGDAASGSTVAMFLDACYPDTIVEENSIYSGDGITCIGIYIKNSDSIIIRNNFVYGGYGDYNNGNSGTRGIAMYSSSGVIEENTIHGGENSNYSTAIIVSLASNPFVRNNIIYGGDPTIDSRGIQCDNSSTGFIANNSICAGTGGNSLGIQLSLGAAPEIINNIVFVAGGSGKYCIYLLDATAGPAKLYNNDLWSTGGATYLYDHGTPYATIASVNLLPYASANIDADPAFVSQNGSDGDISELEDNDWHLSAGTPTAVKNGGSDILSGFFSYDKDGAARSVPWSIGAYERN